MARNQLPSGITKTEVTNRSTGAKEPRWRVKLNPRGADGERHQVNRSFSTEREARAFHAETVGASAAGTYVRASRRTVEDACADWLASRHGLKTTTRRGYKSSLQPVRDELGTIRLQKLTKADIDKLVVALRAGTVEGRRTFTPRTVNQMLFLLDKVLESEQNQGHIVRNVAHLVDKLPANPKKYRTLTESEMYAVLDHECRKRHLWTLALYGLRRGEIAGLKWEHVDFDAGTLSVVENRVDGEDGVVVDTPKSATSARTLPMPTDMVTVLKAARAVQRRERLTLGDAYQGGEYVASDESGRPYSPSQLSDGWHRALKRLGIDQVRLHDARHTCGTLMHLRGVPIAVISQWLGHSSAAFTMAVYAHSQDEALKRAGQTFERREAN